MGNLLKIALNQSSQPFVPVSYEVSGISGGNVGTCTIYRNGNPVWSTSSDTSESSIFMSSGDTIYATFSGTASTLDFYIDNSLDTQYTGSSITTASTVISTGFVYKYNFLVGIV